MNLKVGDGNNVCLGSQILFSIDSAWRCSSMAVSGTAVDCTQGNRSKTLYIGSTSVCEIAVGIGKSTNN
jgi:hypothetical protein